MPASAAASIAAESPSRRMLVAGPAVAAVSIVAALLTTDAAGLPLRDPDHVAGRRLLLVLGLVGVLVVLDVVVRAARRSGTLRPSLAAMQAVRRERWTGSRCVGVGTALVSFYLTYLAYRNLKSVVPVLRPGDLFDRQLADLDRALFSGHDPAALLHDVLGTGPAAHVLSAGYMLFFAFIPVTLAVGLVFSRDLRGGLFYTTAQSINWLLGAGSYFLLPSLGPVYAEPGAFTSLPVSGVTQLQDLLLDQRLEFLRDPAAGTAQSIAAFSSLHVSIFFTAVLAVHLLGLGRRVKIAAWVLLGVTIMSTIYLGWHYVLDDIGGLVLGGMSVALACVLTGFKPRIARPRILGPYASPVTARLRSLALPAPWRDVLAGPLVAVVTVLAAVLATHAVGLPLRDPDHVAALYLALVGFGTVMLVGLDIVVRAARRSETFPPSRAAMRLVRRDRWTVGAGVAAGAALVGFYATYLAYRNLKSVVPLLRPGDLFDRQLAGLDRDLLGGHDPAALLHSLLGTGLTTHVLSAAYVAFIVFLPLTIGLALVFLRDRQAGLFYTTAQSINWVLGIASYFLLPSLGPIYVDPAAFAVLPASEVTHLQDVLLDQRVRFLADPATGTPQSIAAFASLHISMSFTAALAAHLLGLGRRLKIALWIWFAVTAVGTIYLGWHYVLDDVGGVLLGAMALLLARALTGIDLRSARRRRRSAPPSGGPAATAPAQ